MSLPGNRAVSYAYTASGKPAVITDSLGNSISYSYDAAGNKVREEVKDPMENNGKRGRIYFSGSI